jgi:hypothetical protein
MNPISPYVSAGLPNVANAVAGYCLPITVKRLTKTLVNGDLVETEDVQSGRGAIQPFTASQLMIKPEGQRTWVWEALYVVSGVDLSLDDVVTIFDRDFRVMSKRDFTLYGYIKYELVEGYTNG